MTLAESFTPPPELPLGPSLIARGNLPVGFEWSRSISAHAIARAFVPPPNEEIWEWADKRVWLQNEDAAEPGPYRSSKTPWTRRIQELIKNPVNWVWDFTAETWRQVTVTEVSVQKSSQSGFSEACLNGIRWRVSYRPCNVIYAIDTAEEAEKIARRLLRSFKFLDPSIFTGDPDDCRKTEFQLRGMELFFYGSFSTGKFANKQAPLTISDEVEEHGKFVLRAIASRRKTSTGGLQVNLSKPKLKKGPINKAFLRGNQEEFFVPCPHCDYMQPLTFFPEERDCPFSETMEEIRDEQTGKVVARLPRPLPLGEKRKMKTGRMVFEHCKNLLGHWDRYRVLTDTYYECANCRGRIEEGRKRWMIDRGEWRPMEVEGSPNIVSQHFNDLYSEDELSAWGLLVLEYLDAKKEGREALQEFYNHRLGLVWSEEINATDRKVVLSNLSGIPLWFADSTGSDGRPARHIFTDEKSANAHAETAAKLNIIVPVVKSYCLPYKRGTLPFKCYRQSPTAPPTMILGSDVGGIYAKWAVAAVAENLRDMAIIDWGCELDPDAVLALARQRAWKSMDGTDAAKVLLGFIDARHRTKEIYQTCLASYGFLIPTMGLGGASAQNNRLWGFHSVPSYPARMKQFTFNKQRALSATYIDRLQKKHAGRIFLPADVEEYDDGEELIDELTGEEQEENTQGRIIWKDPSPRPNHYGDCVNYCVAGLDFLTRDVPTSKAEN